MQPYRKILTVLTAALIFFPTLALAAPPDAGQLYREQQKTRIEIPRIAPDVKLTTPQAPPSALADNQTRFTLQKIILKGVTVIPQERFLELATPLYGQEISLAGLSALAAKLSEIYQQEGYFLARFHIPAQTIQGGVITLEALEGAAVRQIKTDPADKARVERLFSTVPENAPIKAKALTRSLMLLGEQPGMAPAQLSLSPGVQAGTTALSLDVPESRRHDARIYSDNHGNRYSGRYHLGVQGSFYNLTGLSDRLDLNLSGTDEGTFNGHLGWDTLLANNGLRGGAYVTSGYYELGEEFKSLDATGHSNVLGAGLDYPLLRENRHMLNLRGQFEYRFLEDKYIGLKNKKQVAAGSAGLVGHHRHSLGTTAWGMNVTLGRLEIKDDTFKASDALTADTDGFYSKVNFSAQQETPLVGDLRFRVKGRGQLALNRNLDSSEKFYLGGATGVRSQPQGEATGDHGLIVSPELVYQVCRGWDIGVGYDYGLVRVNRDRYQDGDNSLTRQGVALLLEGRVGLLDLSAAVAWNTGPDANSSPSRATMGWFNVGMNF